MLNGPLVGIERLKATLLTTALLLGSGNWAYPAEVTFLCAAALEPAMKELIPAFQITSGHTVKTSFANLGVISQRVRKGDQFDLAILSPQQWEAVRNEGRINEAMRTIAKVGVGVFVRQGNPRPEIDSVVTLKAAFLKSSSIAIANPAGGSPVGAYALRLFDRLGIAAEIKSKLILANGPGAVFPTVANGNAELGLSQVSEIVAAPGVSLIGPLPAEAQNFTVFTTAIGVNTRQPEVVRALIDFVGSPSAASILRSKGLEPG
jgi:molybdate transport system substrate-binding protein